VEHPDAEDMTPELTVVVATCDRPRPLARCLGALQRQLGIDALELLVVDDGSRDHGAVAAIAGDAGAQLVRGTRRGLSAARNAGVARASAPFVAFLDDDVECATTWAASMVRRLRDGAAAVTGPIAAEPPRDRVAAASQLLANSLIDPNAPSTRRTRSAPAANLACRLELARAIPFDEAYNGIGAEDRDWCARLAASGEVLAFEPDAGVRHAQNLTLRGFCRRQYLYGRGARLYRHRHEGGRLAPPRFYARLIRDGFRAGGVVGILVLVGQIAAAAGYFREASTRGDASPVGRVSRRTESEAESRAA
jgi:glycosyltransferase involved in cell wall biosynthesis